MTMKIELLLHTLTTNSKSCKCKIKVQIGEVSLQSTEQVSIKGTFPFLQKNILEVSQSNLQYIYFQLVSDNRKVGNKTLFIDEAINKKSINFHSLQGKQIFTLNFQLRLTSIDVKQQSQFRPFKRSISMEEEPDHLSEGQGKLKVIKLGVLGYNFAQRIDLLVHIKKKMLSIMEWEEPLQTIGIIFFISLMVLFPKICISVLSVALFFGKHKIYRKIQEYQSEEDPSKRVLVPEQNITYLLDLVQNYCHYFDQMNKFVRQDDKATIVIFVQNLCKLGILVHILLLLLTIQNLILVTIWFTFLIFSPMRKKVIQFVLSILVQINNFVDQGIQKIEKIPFGFLLRVHPKQVSIIKQLYIYEYHRWWLGKQWVPTHWSDQNRQIHLSAIKQAPNGWEWLENWKFQTSDITDQDGFEYTADFSKNYSPSSILKTIRRRKWTRKCLRLNVITPLKAGIKLQDNQKNQILTFQASKNQIATSSSSILHEIGLCIKKYNENI